MNEASFAEHSERSQPYQPISTIHYGGVQGIHLSKLIEIAVWIIDYSWIHGIEFIYNAKVDGLRIHTLGRRGPFSDTKLRSCGPCNNSTDQRISFRIDGPGGEVIDGVDIQRTSGLPLQAFQVRLPSSSETL